MANNLSEGALTCLLGVVAFFYLPHSAATPKSFFGRSYNVFTPQEAAILTTRTLREDPLKANGYHTAVQLKDIKDTLLDWRVYGHIIAAFLSMYVSHSYNVPWVKYTNESLG